MSNETTYAGTISKVKVSSGNIYEIADSWARAQIEAITGGSAVVFKGVSSTPLTDGGNENPTVNNTVVTTKNTGDLYFVGNDEYIYGADQKWHWLGNQLGQLGDLAYKNSATATYTPSGTVTQPTFSGTPATISIVGTTASISHTNTAITGGAATITAKGTPAGTVSQPTFSGALLSATAAYTPAGTISKPNVNVSNSTKGINYISNVGTLPTWTSTVEDETLQFTFTTGALPSTTSVNVTTGVSASLAASPSFSGTAATVTAQGTPAGTVSQPTFSGAELSATAAYTPAGTYQKASLSTGASTFSGTYTPAGTVSQPTFNGTSATITVS